VYASVGTRVLILIWPVVNDISTTGKILIQRVRPSFAEG
jgi:hypothetical protein